MLELIRNIANLVRSLFDFLCNFVEGVVDFLALVVQAPGFLIHAVSYLPSLLSFFAVAMISVLVIKVVVNR